MPQAGQQIRLELNGATGRLLLVVPAYLTPLGNATYTEEVVTTTEMPPGSAPQEERKTTQKPLNLFPGQLTLTAAATSIGGALLIDDPFALSAGKHSGQRTVKASYGNGNAVVEGTLVMTYTLTPR